MTRLEIILLALAVSVACGALGSAGGWYARGVVADRDALKVQSTIEATREAARQGAADEIAKIKPRNVTIRQEVEREIVENVVYRDCRVPAGGVQLVNEAATGQSARKD